MNDHSASTFVNIAPSPSTLALRPSPSPTCLRTEESAADESWLVKLAQLLHIKKARELLRDNLRDKSSSVSTARQASDGWCGWARSSQSQLR